MRVSFSSSSVPACLLSVSPLSPPSLRWVGWPLSYSLRLLLLYLSSFLHVCFFFLCVGLTMSRPSKLEELKEDDSRRKNAKVCTRGLGVGTHRGRCTNLIIGRSTTGLCHACYTPPPGAWNPTVVLLFSWCCYPLRVALGFSARPRVPRKTKPVEQGFVNCAFCNLRWSSYL